jgi:hypothetical protein
MDKQAEKILKEAKRDAERVKRLGEEIGYGNLMELASALWRKNLKQLGIPETGAFIPTVKCMLKEEYQNDARLDASNKMYDEFVKDVQ